MLDLGYTNFIKNVYCYNRKPVSTILVKGEIVCYCMFEDICNPQHDNVKSTGRCEILPSYSGKQVQHCLVDKVVVHTSYGMTKMASR